MIEITFYRFASCCGIGIFTPYYLTHIEAELRQLSEDGSRGVPFVVSFGSEGEPTPLTAAEKREAVEVTLRVEGDLSQFIQDYKSRFHSSEYDFCSKNCADGAYYILEYFFGDDPTFEKIDRGCDIYKLLCCLPCVGSLGIAACFPVPPCFQSPRDVFDKAVVLSKTTARLTVERARLINGSDDKLAARYGASDLDVESLPTDGVRQRP